MLINHSIKQTNLKTSDDSLFDQDFIGLDISQKFEDVALGDILDHVDAGGGDVVSRADEGQDNGVEQADQKHKDEDNPKVVGTCVTTIVWWFERGVEEHGLAMTGHGEATSIKYDQKRNVL